MKDVLPSPLRSTPDTDLLDCRPVRDDTELAVHHRIRHAVFVTEQRLFTDDTDTHDADPATIHVLGFVAGIPAGAVRLYRLDAGIWKGDRLAVLRNYRHAGLGGPLVQCAVRTAGELGGQRMLAQVQVPNVRFFEHLGWSRLGDPADYVGVPHQQMVIALR